ncbi:MAG: hypothetical protein CMO55_20875 [Verrucomicrobiales bacterium]|nr:hypothetical protein [Verrucomicrobiales bacterium]
MATITIYVPDQEPLELALDGYEQVSIGRGPDNDVVIDHVSISGSHAVIYNLGGTFQVNDQGSTNGTFLNGEPISEGVLSNGARVMFGSVESVFADEAAEGEEGDAGFAAGGGGSGYASGHQAHLADVSNKPSGFTDLSPIEKVVKKDVVGQLAMILGVVAILAAIAVAALAFTMKAA